MGHQSVEKMWRQRRCGPHVHQRLHKCWQHGTGVWSGSRRCGQRVSAENWIFCSSFWRNSGTTENKVKNEMWKLAAGWLRKRRWQWEVGNLYSSCFCPSIRAGLLDPAHFSIAPFFLSCSPPSSLMLSFTHMFPFFLNLQHIICVQGDIQSIYCVNT